MVLSAVFAESTILLRLAAEDEPYARPFRGILYGNE